MKKLMCLLVVFLISNAANAADKWEYVQFSLVSLGNSTMFSLQYPNVVNPDAGKTDIWNVKTADKNIIPPKNFKLFVAKELELTAQQLASLFKRDFSEPAEVINALGFLGFEMCASEVVARHGSKSTASLYWFKRKIK